MFDQLFQSNSMIAAYNTTQATQHIKALLKEAEQNGAVVITKKNEPAAIVIPMSSDGVQQHLSLLFRLLDEDNAENVEPNLQPLYHTMQNLRHSESVLALENLRPNAVKPTPAEVMIPIFGLWANHGIEGDSGEYLATMRQQRAKRHESTKKSRKSKV
jgi:prevent-host-death family protein